MGAAVMVELNRTSPHPNPLPEEAGARRSRGWGQRDSAYTRWLRNEDLPVYTGSFVGDLRTTEVAPWPRIGQKGALVSLASQQQTDGWLMEIAPREHTEPIHHLFECSYYVLEGT